MDKRATTSAMLTLPRDVSPVLERLLSASPNLGAAWPVLRRELPEFAQGLGDVVRRINASGTNLGSRHLRLRSGVPGFSEFPNEIGGQITIHQPWVETLAHEAGHAVDHASGYPSRGQTGWTPRINSEIFANRWAQDLLGPSNNVKNLFAQSTYNNHYLREHSDSYQSAMRDYIRTVQGTGHGLGWDGDLGSWYRIQETAGANPLTNPRVGSDPAVHRAYGRLVDIHADTLRRQGFGDAVDHYASAATHPAPRDHALFKMAGVTAPPSPRGRCSADNDRARAHRTESLYTPPRVG